MIRGVRFESNILKFCIVISVSGDTCVCLANHLFTVADNFWHGSSENASSMLYILSVSVFLLLRCVGPTSYS